MEKILISIALVFAILAFSLNLIKFEPVKQFVEEILNATQIFNLYQYEKVESIDVMQQENFAIITLNFKCYKLQANIDNTQAKSILNALHKKREERPLTHDLLVDLMNETNIEFLMLKVEDLKTLSDGSRAYIGSCIFRKDKKIVSIDCRPSDGTAIALRLEKPIYVKKEILEKYGTKTC